MNDSQEIFLIPEQKNGSVNPALKRRVPVDIQSRVNYLTGLISTELRKLSDSGLSLDRNAQEELSNIVNLIQSIEKRFIYNSVKGVKDCDARQEQLLANLDFVQTALESVLQKNPNVCFAKRIRRNIIYSLHESDNPVQGYWKNFFLNIIHLGSTPTKLISGLVLSLPLYALLASLSISGLTSLSRVVEKDSEKSIASNVGGAVPKTSTIEARQLMTVTPEYFRILALLALVGSAGALGSIISILTRIEEYQNRDYDDSILPIVIGACKPLIGASFGILLFTLSCSTISPLQISDNANKPGTRGFTFFSLAFIVGFSERFAKDIISRTEVNISGSTSPGQKKAE